MEPVWLVVLLLLVCAALLVWLLISVRGRRESTATDLVSSFAPHLERLERELRDELGRSGQGTRTDLANVQQVLLAQSGDVARTQNAQIDAFAQQLALMQKGLNDTLAQRLSGVNDTLTSRLQTVTDTLNTQLQSLSESNQRRVADMRTTLEAKLTELQKGNEAKLDEMRRTVDEKLHATLEQRLGESFKQVADRLEQVHRGLGEMQGLARDVGSLNRVLTNVKTRGVFGEVQLAGLLEQVFTPEQYATNVATVPGSNERVEFAIRLPGRGESAKETPLWLPIDAKFPREDYERLLDAADKADVVAMEQSAKAIEVRLKAEAKTIRDKYLSPPHTTDFGILFVPTEGLYAEALRRPGLVEGLQREYKVMLCGPTTLLATLNSLQMGFRTLALEKRSTEVWEVLGAVKTEFQKFGDVLAKTKKKLDEASSTIEQAETRSRAMARQLRTVEALPGEAAAARLGFADDEDATASDATPAPAPKPEALF